MKRHVMTLALLAVAGMAIGPARPARADLAGYLAAPEKAYRWEKVAEEKLSGGTVYELRMISQTWQGIEWNHGISIYRPDNLAHPNFCTLINAGGYNPRSYDSLGILLAARSGAIFAVVDGNPKQPLYGDLKEDALIVYTWKKFIETGDETWPLHFPMTKAVIKAMDTIQAFTAQQGQPTIDSFIISGASKRGWTTWLAGASRDSRVKAIAPMVIDTLNLAKQFPHELAAYGKASEQIKDYTNSGMFDALKTARGKRLLELEDPWSYRNQLTLPKLIILGTNDRYWTQDALNIYWDDLKGPKWVTYTPDSGHDMEDKPHIFATLTAFIDSIAGHKAWPKMQWKYAETADSVTLTTGSDIPAKAARLFRVFAPTQDFRDCKWESVPMEAAGAGFTGNLAKPATGYAATFGELEYEVDGKTFTLSTQMHILAHK